METGKAVQGPVRARRCLVRNVMPGLGRACRKLGLSFFAYLGDRFGLCASSSAKRGGRTGWLSGFAELILLVLLQVVHVEVAVSFEPVLMRLHGQRPHQPAA